MILDAAERPRAPACPACEATLAYVDTETSFDAFRPDPAAPRTPIHHYDCNSCGTAWKLGQQLERDPIRQLLKGANSPAAQHDRGVDRPKEVEPPAPPGVALVVAVLALPSIAFLAGLAANAYLPTPVVSGRQGLLNGISYALAFGAMGSIVCGPLAVAGTVWNFRRMAPRDQTLASIAAVVAMLPLVLMALLLFGLSQMR
jgi:hypothetical protein